MWRPTGGLAKGSFRGTARRMPERTGGEEVEMVLAVREAETWPRSQRILQHLCGFRVTGTWWVQSHLERQEQW